MLIRPLCCFVSMVTSGLTGVPPVFVHTTSIFITPLPVHALASFMSFRFHGCTKACCYIVCLHHVAPMVMTHHYMFTLGILSYHLASMVTSWLASVSPVFVHVASMVMTLHYFESFVMSFHFAVHLSYMLRTKV
jgi:hypothetical protein